MIESTKTTINKTIWKAFDDHQDIQGHFLIKGTDTIVDILITFTERVTFVDENGVKWYKA
jgi:hypothetical protein